MISVKEALGIHDILIEKFGGATGNKVAGACCFVFYEGLPARTSFA